jgi:hypothetical protein
VDASLSPDGTWILLLAGSQLLAADVAGDGTLPPTRRVIADLGALRAILGTGVAQEYNMSPDERGLVFTRRQPGAERVMLVHNWVRELRERAGERTP